MTTLPPLLTVADRKAAGHARRAVISRSGHADWAPAISRADPVALLKAADEGRIAALLPIRYGRMAADPFAFLRGAAPVIAADIGPRPQTGIRVQLGGDAHLANFGAMAGLAGEALFDVNDFDETIPGPFEWDLKRLAASLVVAGRVEDLSDKACRALARRAVQAYRREIQNLASTAPFGAWCSRVLLNDAIEEIGERDVRKRERHRLGMIVQSELDGHRHLVSSRGLLRLPERPTATRCCCNSRKPMKPCSPAMQGRARMRIREPAWWSVSGCCRLSPIYSWAGRNRMGGTSMSAA